MRLLSIETSHSRGAIALLDHGRTLFERRLAGGQRTAQALTPAIRDALAEADWPMDSVSIIAVSRGPGSFTGLRIGITAAKTMAYALGADLIAVDTLRVLAHQAPVEAYRVHPVIDAQRGQLIAAIYERQSPTNEAAIETAIPATAMTLTTTARILSPEQWIAQLDGGLAIGDGLRRLDWAPVEGVSIADEELWRPSPRVLGELAYADHQAGRRDDLWRLSPDYYRPSAAEEKAAQRENPGATP